MSSDTPLSPNDHLRQLEKLVRELTPDAERYRWLRVGRKGTYNNVLIYTGETLDAAIDAARAKEPK